MSEIFYYLYHHLININETIQPVCRAPIPPPVCSCSNAHNILSRASFLTPIHHHSILHSGIRIFLFLVAYPLSSYHCTRTCCGISLYRFHASCLLSTYPHKCHHSCTDKLLALTFCPSSRILRIVLR